MSVFIPFFFNFVLLCLSFTLPCFVCASVPEQTHSFSHNHQQHQCRSFADYEILGYVTVAPTP